MSGHLGPEGGACEGEAERVQASTPQGGDLIGIVGRSLGRGGDVVDLANTAAR
jgi:hypothetical protein